MKRRKITDDKGQPRKAPSAFQASPMWEWELRPEMPGPCRRLSVEEIKRLYPGVRISRARYEERNESSRRYKEEQRRNKA